MHIDLESCALARLRIQGVCCDFLCRLSCDLQIRTVLFLPLWSICLFFFLPYCTGKLSVLCWIALLGTDILDLSFSLSQLSILGFFVVVLFCRYSLSSWKVENCFLFLNFWAFFHDWCFVRCVFFISLYDHVVYLLLPVNIVDYIDWFFWILIQPWNPGIHSYLIILCNFLYCWVLFANILLRTFVSVFMRCDTGLNFFFGTVFFWFWY